MHDLTSTFSLGIAASLGVAAVTALWLSPCAAGPAHDPGRAAALPTNLAELRARGPAGLAELLARYDRRVESEPSSAPAWEAAIDTVAGQRYASTSRLYWYTDLLLAEQEARRQHRPILALRLLGDLRNDLSCANSRLFRATLYANAEVSAFLRDHFVLYWSTERPVPIVTIDFGDGKKLVRTTTGNSAHYVLDDRGRVLDVLPGLYAPSVFRTELTRSLALARQVRGKPDAERIRATVAYHAAAIAATDRAWQQEGGTQYIHGARTLHGSTTLAQAQSTTLSKMMVEAPDLRAIGALQPGEVTDDSAAWSAIGQKVWNITGPARPGADPLPAVLDPRSRSLVEAIYTGGPVAQPAHPDQIADVIARLEQHIVADTALNQFRLRPQIHRWIVDRAETRFAALNGWIYAEVFATPSSDSWLGLLPRTDFTGLPGDGVVMP